jgi:hypothetical protein
MPWDISDVPGVTSTEDSTTLSEWRHRQEERGRHAPHRHPHHPPEHAEPSKPEAPATPDPVDPAQVPHLNILA